MVRSLILTAIAASVLAYPAWAEDLSQKPADTPGTAPLSVDTSPNWTGFWAGGQLGVASVSTNVTSGREEGFIAGLTAGFDYDFGRVVLGGGLDYDFTNTDVGNTNTDLENVFRVRLRGGFEIGNGLLYGTGGYAQADTDTLGSDDGYFLGAGYEYLVSPRFSYGGELLYQDFGNYSGTATDVDATTVQLRGTFRF